MDKTTNNTECVFRGGPCCGHTCMFHRDGGCIFVAMYRIAVREYERRV